jgi:Rrf2 family transcriptional regulator, iron-sulfur cluster assembly transcription factor
MKLSTKSRYGTRAMLDIALNDGHGPVQLKDLAKRQDLSMKYLEQIVPNLKNAGLIRSIRGAGGGYILAKPARNITLLDIVEPLEGTLVPVECVGNPHVCHRIKECAVHDIWREVQLSMNNILKSHTLADLAEQQRAKSKHSKQPVICSAKLKLSFT